MPEQHDAREPEDPAAGGTTRPARSRAVQGPPAAAADPAGRERWALEAAGIAAREARAPTHRDEGAPAETRGRARLLLLEPDRDFSAVLARVLDHAGYTVVAPADVGPEAAATLADDCDVVVIGVDSQPGLAHETVAALRRAGTRAPILLVVGEDATEELVRVARPAGAARADGSPDIEDLLAAVAALLRDTPADGIRRIRCGRLVVDRIAHRAHYDDVELSLTPTEYRILEALALREGEVVQREDLDDAVWPGGSTASNVLNVHIAHLRRKLLRASGRRLIRTVRGVGFALRCGGTS